ncbi:hypothetical protein [Amycolatopsis australiensis]|uniref:hypothetical protein n=1 Tax=Amycolatopsis australiensis TaxID=546364 RepID=UPI0015A61833|nr:hypothetical protein [Amycolatopsis australiensis]
MNWRFTPTGVELLLARSHPSSKENRDVKYWKRRVFDRHVLVDGEAAQVLDSAGGRFG